VESKRYEVQGYTVTFKGMMDKKRVINVFEVKYFNLSQVKVLMMANQQLVEVESIKELHTSSRLKTGRW
jgi:predicted RNA-binding protein with EMAP domain